jgi:hypothetical protein
MVRLLKSGKGVSGTTVAAPEMFKLKGAGGRE